MPKLATASKLTTTTTTTVKLAPKLRAKLEKLMSSWEVQNAVEKGAAAAKKVATSEIDKVMSDAGEFKALEEGIEIGRFKAKMVFPSSTRWDEDKLRSYLTPAQMEECKTTTPGTGYVKVSAGKE